MTRTSVADTRYISANKFCFSPPSEHSYFNVDPPNKSSMPSHTTFISSYLHTLTFSLFPLQFTRVY